MQTVHFVYAIPESTHPIYYRWDKLAKKYNFLPPSYRNGKNISWATPNAAPFSITYQIMTALKKEYKVKLYDWREQKVCDMKENDILLFHPTPDFANLDSNQIGEIGNNSIGWKTLEKYPNCKSIVISPYAHPPNETGWLNKIFEKYTKKLIIICGKYWKDTWQESYYNSIITNPLQVNMGVLPEDYPIQKKTFNPKGKRKFLYIGNTQPWKNTAQLELIAKEYPHFEGGYISGGNINGWTKIADFAYLTPDFMAKICKKYDFFLSVSIFDAQATTVMEQMCFGMPVACTPESGYTHHSVIPLHTTDTALNCQQIEKMQQMDEQEIEKIVEDNLREVHQSHNWDKICLDIMDFIKT